MPTPEESRKIMFELDGDTKPLDQKADAAIKRIKDLKAEITLGINTSELNQNIKKIQTTIDSFLRKNDKNEFKIAVEGIDQMLESFTEISSKLDEVSQKISFDNIRPLGDI